jgi:hypothetical protein
VSQLALELRFRDSTLEFRETQELGQGSANSGCLGFGIIECYFNNALQNDSIPLIVIISVHYIPSRMHLP